MSCNISIRTTILIAFILIVQSKTDQNICQISTGDSAQTQCPTVQKKGSFDSMNVSIPTEQEIAEAGHLYGAVPIHYDWETNFFVDNDEKKFSGNVSVIFKLVKSTKRLLLNAQDIELLGSITLHQCDTKKQLCPTVLAINNQEGWLSLDFDQELAKGKEYRLTFNGYNGNVGQPSYDEQTTRGVWRNNYNSDNWALATIFQMRGARKAFPCFDQPSLKATFSVCIRHEKNLLALSNTEVKQETSNSGNKVTHCFEKTPKVPTYVVTVSLLSNFTRLVDESKQPKLEIFFSSKDDPNKYRWQIEEARRILNFFKDKLHLTYNLTKLGLLNLSPVQFWGIENFGLVSIESGTRSNMRNRDELIHRILVHEIVHQWLGNVATISYWNEICLQEGLTAFLEWTITEKLKLVNASFSSVVEENMESVFNPKSLPYVEDSVIDKFTRTQSIANYCFTRPPLIFNMITDAFGDDVMLKFMTKYAEKFAYSAANFNDWVELLNFVANDTRAGATLHSWFHEKGRPIIYAKLISPTEVLVQQKTSINSRARIPEKGFKIPYKLKTNNGVWTKIFYINGVNTTVALNDNAVVNGSFFLDPDMITYTRKLYSPENYLQIFKCYGNSKTKPCYITKDQIKYLLNQFCWGLSRQHLPWSFGSESDQDKQNWSSLMSYLREITLNGTIENNPCECAVFTKEDITSDHKDCTSEWNSGWSKRKIMKLLQREYKVPSEPDSEDY